MQIYIRTIKRIWEIYHPFHKYIYLQVFFIVILEAITIGNAGIMSKIISSLGDKNVNIIFFLLSGWFLLSVSQSLISYISNRNTIFNLSTPSEQYLQEYSFKKILDLTIEQHVSDHSAIKREVISRGENALASFRNTLFQDILPGIAFMLIALGTLAYTNIYLGIYALIISVIILVWSKMYLERYIPLYEKDRRNWIEQSKTRMEAFSHLPLVKYLAGENGFVKKYTNDRAEKLKFFYKVSDMQVKHRGQKGAFNDFSEFLGAAISVFLFLNGHIALGAIYLVFTLNSRVFGRIMHLQNVMRNIPILMVDIKKYFEAIDKRPSYREDGVTVDTYQDIHVTGLSFSLDQNPILKNLSVVIKKGHKTALVGTSGSGKSTFVKLLLRAYNYTEGSIKIGDTELSNIDAKYLRRRIGYVEQQVDLFDDTVKNNILFGVEDNFLKDPEKDIEEVSKKARITEFYYRLAKDGLNTLVGERGIKLSGGERQRVGIARALIRNPDILIFDEATSALDTENESFIKEAIDEASKGRTTIIIAHRLSTVRDADKIVVMDKGTVVAEGTHGELLEKSTHYQTLVAHQLSE